MHIELIKAEAPAVVETLFQYYLYDMSEYTGWNPDANGSYGVSPQVTQLYDYWRKDDHHPLLIKVDGELAGFSLLRRYPFDPDYYDIGQFFVLRKYKRQGVGATAFGKSVSKFPGKWLTRVLPENTGALAFWQTVISAVAAEPLTVSTENYGDKVMKFIRYTVTS